MYYAASVKKGKCVGCGLCIVSCPEANAIQLIKLNGKAKVVEISELRCKGCGLCVEVCPKDALEVVRR
ncbi:TPA: 4Fe-4S ferredoxin [Candidatus Acetothermia bacterium]|nr:4Fe-4S ferredoxin [Candidatus Acetothermia bacterium]